MENKEVEVEHPWEQEEDELEEGLVTTRKNLNQTPISTTINGDFSSNTVDSVGVTNGKHHHQQQEQEEQQDEEEEEDFIEQNDTKVDEAEEEKQKISEFCVYFDTDKDIAKNHVPEYTEITINNQLNGNGLHYVISKQNGEHQKHEISIEGDKSSPPYINNKPEITDVVDEITEYDVETVVKKHEISIEGDKSSPSYTNITEINDVDETTEYDVEAVIKKQDTHDLFCPNCNSCITKRVILRKRKRRIPVPGEDPKRSKPQTPISSEVNAVLNDSSDNQALNGVDSRLDDVQPPISDEYDHQREPDVFRCLSCFSIFVPTGDGFKLFRVFGNKSNEHSNEEVPVKKSWFSNFWRSEKVEPNVTDLNDSGVVQSLDAENNVGGVSSSLNSSVQEANSHTTNGTIDLENNQLQSDKVIRDNMKLSVQEANSHTINGMTDLEKNQLQSDKVARESNGKMATDSTLADNQEQLLTSYHIEKDSNNKSEHPGVFVVKPPLINVEPTESSISPLQHDGLKLLVPPNVGSLIIDNSQMNQELDVTVQTNGPGLDEKERTNLSFSPPASKRGQLNLGAQVNGLGLPITLAINGKEQKMEKNNVQSRDVMFEVSQHTVQNNVEIHLEEPLKVNKDVLTDKQIKLLEDVNNIERLKGKETIITIESKQLDVSVSQIPADTLGATGTSALQQVVAQGRVATATGGGRSVDIIKSMVYGGLVELITSLSVVSSAAGGDAATLNVVALGLANIFGGLFVITHDLWTLKNEKTRKTEDRYQQLLGQRADFPLHMTLSLLSYLIFGFLPPVVYGFAFYESNDKDLKLLVVAAASLVCIMILAAGKAYVQTPRKSYFKTIGYYVMFVFMVSGVSYVFGGLIIKLLEKMDIFHEGTAENLRIHGASSKQAMAAL